MSRWIFAVTACAFASPAFADDFVPARPGNTESPIAVPAGRWQVETEIASAAHGHGATSWSALQTEFRYGLPSDWDVEAIVSPYQRSDASGDVNEGAGDLTLRALHTFAGEDGNGPAFALIGYVTLPTATGGVGDGAAEGGVIATGTFPVAQSTTLTWTAAAADVSDDGRYVSDVYGGLNISQQLSDKVGAYAEAFADRSEHQTAATLDLGATYLSDAHTQWDMGADLGITRAADATRLFVGWAHLF